MPFPIKFLRLAEFILTISMIALAFVDYFLDVNLYSIFLDKLIIRYLINFGHI